MLAEDVVMAEVGSVRSVIGPLGRFTFNTAIQGPVFAKVPAI